MFDCKHPHLKFEDGDLWLTCIDCGQYWGALTNKGGEIDFTRMGAPFFDETRHTKWEIPRNTPRKPTK